jgi:cytochrome P450
MALLPAFEFILDNKFSLLAFAIVVQVVTTCIYRRFFHPLANIPGPFLPAVTKLYQTYHNRRYYLEIERLHNKYGPIVRINPNEVHLAADADNYDRIHHVGSKYSKSPNFYNAMCAPHSSFGTLNNEAHRIKRGAMNPMFSRQKVLDLESIVQAKVDKVIRRVQEGLEADTPVDLHHAFRAVSVDVASEFSFGECYDFLDKDDTGAYFFEMARGIGPALYVFQQFPSLQSLALKTPPWLAPWLSRPLGYVTALQVECVAQIENVKKKISEGRDVGRQTIFTTLLSERDKPDGFRVPSTWELKDEAYSVLVAAADTTGNAMTVAAFNVLHNSEIYKKLAAELRTRFPDPDSQLSFVELEKLPYLVSLTRRATLPPCSPFFTMENTQELTTFTSLKSATIRESLRLSFGVVGRLPRLVPEPGATFNSHFLPAGTVVGTSSWQMHREPNIFPNPMEFSPERWLQSTEESNRLNRYMVPFGKGSRMCVGMPLAYAEVYVMLGRLFWRFDGGEGRRGLRVWGEGTKEVIGDYEDYFSSYHPYAKRGDWFRVVGEKGC